MMSPKSTAQRAWLLPLLLVLATCSAGDTDFLVINLQGVPTVTSSLRFSAALDGQPAPMTGSSDAAQRQIAVGVPRRLSGSLTVTVEALGPAPCTTASGALTLTVPRKSTEELTLTLGDKDADCDGDPTATDCDDHDARRFHGNARARNCCTCTDPASCQSDHSQRSDRSACEGRCGSGLDFDCTGVAVDCFVDDDCDGYSPSDPIAARRDCDDKNSLVHPGAVKDCKDPTHDWACDGLPQAGCVPCDLDGDGFQRMDASCPLMGYTGKVDCDDDDRGVFPDSTKTDSLTLIRHDLNGQEGGSVAGALRGLCRNVRPDLASAQDADCDGDARKGCPTALCDKDGDGFPNAGAGCNPSGLQLDCDDSDPRTFPGAPELCGDGKAQSCGADSPCSSDADGDKYNADVDCNDKDPAVHPFASESCNGKDDDCDGLVDELNPDPSGARLVQTLNGKSQTTSCTDKNTGLCGQKSAAGFYSGRCVCTGQDPRTLHDPDANRVACPGTRDGDALAPKCFGAYQPQPQTCDADNPRDDDCDGDTSDKTGKNLKELGSTCGVSRGNCNAGKVIGCDRSKVNPFSTFAVPGFAAKDRFLVCDTVTTRYPAQEVCNGMDDDCDGALPGDPKSAMSVLQPGVNPKAPDGDEADHDGDKYLGCRNCNGQPLAFGVSGCNDCNDLDSAVYPGAKESCDGKNNACAASYVDGSGDCLAAGQACCAGLPMCVDTSSNFQRCGGCARPCDAKTASACVQGSCKCAADAACSGAKPLCKAGFGCVECLANTDCKNPLKPACDPATSLCVACLTDAHCGGATPKCSTATRTCVECNVAADCGRRGDGCDATHVCTCKGAAECNGSFLFCDNNNPGNLALTCVECTLDADCKDANRPACEKTTGVCVQCTATKTSKCTGLLPACDVAQNKCVECNLDADCGTRGDTCSAMHVCQCKGGAAATGAACSGATPLCNTNVAQSPLACVECNADADCKTASKPACNKATGACVACTTANQTLCMTIPATPVCEPTTSSCVACISDSSCTTVAKPACNTTNTTDVCVECTADSYCTYNSKGGRCGAIAANVCGCSNDSQCYDNGAGYKCLGTGSCGCASNVACTGNPNGPTCAGSICTCASNGECASSEFGSLCKAGASRTCGCSTNANCTASDLGTTCIGTVNRCGCSSNTLVNNTQSAECTASFFGKRCNVQTRSCGCSTNTDCVGNGAGKVCITATKRCGCEADADCASFSCDSGTKLCNP